MRVPLNLILYLLRALDYAIAKIFTKLRGWRREKEREIKINGYGYKLDSTLMAVMCRRKKNKIKEIKRLREKRINEVLRQERERKREKERERGKNGTILDNNRPSFLSNYLKYALA